MVEQLRFLRGIVLGASKPRNAETARDINVTYATIRGGDLGADQAEALLREVLLHLDLMHDFDHKREHPPRRLKDMTDKALHRVQCDFRVVWHAGRALELVLHRIYAAANNKILGRKYPGASDKQVRAERSDRHRVQNVYDTLIHSCVNTHPDLEKALEHCFQKALHEGMEDIERGGQWYWRYISGRDSPFLLGSVQQLSAGREVTADHSVSYFYNMSDVTTGFETMPDDFRERMGSDIATFWRNPCATFVDFLCQADHAYYGHLPMRYADYWWRDHEDFRPYIRVGSRFFGRLVENLVELAKSTWIMEELYFQRQMKRISDYNRDYGKQMIEDWSDGSVVLPDVRINEEYLRRFTYPDPANYDYGILHKNQLAKRVALEGPEVDSEADQDSA